MVSASLPPSDLIELGRISDAYGIRGWVKVQPHSAEADALLGVSQWWLKAPGLAQKTVQSPVQQSAPKTVAQSAPQPPSGSGASSRPSSAPQSIQVLASRPQGSTVVAQFQGFANRNQAESLKGYSVWVSRAQFPPPEPDEYYWVDLLGCTLFGEDGQGRQVLLGTVADVTDNGAHAVLKVHCMQAQPDGSALPLLDARGRPREMLVPFVQAHVHTVNLSERQLFSNWPPEL